MRDLQEDSGAVSHIRVRADGPPVGEVHQDFQSLADDLVGFLATDIYDEADSAGIMLVFGIVHTLGFRKSVGH
jgi:hypothetical protein